jgi:hypothetical protein
VIVIPELLLQSKEFVAVPEVPTVNTMQLRATQLKAGWPLFTAIVTSGVEEFGLPDPTKIGREADPVHVGGFERFNVRAWVIVRQRGPIRDSEVNVVAEAGRERKNELLEDAAAPADMMIFPYVPPPVINDLEAAAV